MKLDLCSSAIDAEMMEFSVLVRGATRLIFMTRSFSAQIDALSSGPRLTRLLAAKTAPSDRH